MHGKNPIRKGGMSFQTKSCLRLDLQDKEDN